MHTASDSTAPDACADTCAQRITALLDPDAYAHPVQSVRLLETHISWVLVAGDYAYKIKKPVDFGFLDFSTLDKRHYFCQEEVRLNRRLAPEWYLDVVPVTAQGARCQMNGSGPVVEYAVRMRAFPADATLDRCGSILPTQMDAIADAVATFHQRTATAPDKGDYGSPASVLAPARENFRQIRSHPLAGEFEAVLDRLELWTQSEAERLQEHFVRRRDEGFIRECHGDLHLGNIAWVNDAPLIFDCIEFNPGLRFIDVVSEVAFLFMDLEARGHPALAWRFLNRWLEQTGDYEGMAAFRFYRVYRAMVRAKVALLGAGPDDAGALQAARQYVDLAVRASTISPAALWLMHGVSGSGKSWLSQALLERCGALRLRSDVERKRLFGLAPLASSDTVAGGIYGSEASRQTFARLQAWAAYLLGEHFLVIVDATFLHRLHRQPFEAKADTLNLPWRIISLSAPESRLKARVLERQQAGSDPSEATLEILERQLAGREPLGPDELRHQCPWDSESQDDLAELVVCLNPSNVVDAAQNLDPPLLGNGPSRS